MLGLFPYLASFLFELGETSLSIAGIVIAGFAVGGLFYTMTVSRFLPRLGVNGMMITGASLVGLQLAAIAFGPGWKIQAISLLLMGWGFYMIHGCLQVFASELSVEARATALSLHSFFFFMGQTVGPIAYGFGIQNAGKIATLLTSAVIIIALGFACARLLRQTRPGGCRRHIGLTPPNLVAAKPARKKAITSSTAARVGWPGPSMRSPVKTECGGFPRAFMPAGLPALSGSSVPVKAAPNAVRKVAKRDAWQSVSPSKR